MDSDTVNIVLVVVQIIVAIVVGAAVPWAFKIESQLSRVTTLLEAANERDNKIASLEQEVNELKIKIASISS